MHDNSKIYLQMPGFLKSGFTEAQHSVPWLSVGRALFYHGLSDILLPWSEAYPTFIRNGLPDILPQGLTYHMTLSCWIYSSLRDISLGKGL